MKKTIEPSFKGYQKFLHTVEENIDETSKKYLGADNLVHRHKRVNLIMFWVFSIVGIIFLAVNYYCARILNKDTLLITAATILYWIWLLNYRIPVFDGIAAAFLRERYHGSKTVEHFGRLVSALDLTGIISILKRFKSFTTAKTLLLADIYDERSKQARLPGFDPGRSTFGKFGLTLFSGVLAMLLVECFKLANEHQSEIITMAICSVFGAITLYTFIANGESRRLAETASLLRRAALQAPE